MNLTRQETKKTFTILVEVGMANESTNTTQTSVWMAQHNERTRLHDLSFTPSTPTMQPTRAHAVSKRSRKMLLATAI